MKNELHPYEVYTLTKSEVIKIKKMTTKYFGFNPRGLTDGVLFYTMGAAESSHSLTRG